MVPLAIGQAANVRVGFWSGAGQPRSPRVMRGFVALALGVGFMTLSGIVLIAAPHWIVGLYLQLDDPANAATVTLASSLLGVAAIFQIVDGMQTARIRQPARFERHAHTNDRRRIRLLGDWFFRPAIRSPFMPGWSVRGLWVGPRGRTRERPRCSSTLRFHKLSLRRVPVAADAPPAASGLNAGNGLAVSVQRPRCVMSSL